MSVQNAAAFLDRIDHEADLSAQIQNNDDAVRAGAELNIPFTLEELAEAQAERSSDLSSEDMQNVAGGRRGPFL